MSKTKFIQNQILKLKPKSQLKRSDDFYDRYLDEVIANDPEIRFLRIYDDKYLEVGFGKSVEDLGWDTKVLIENIEAPEPIKISKDIKNKIKQILDTFKLMNYEDRGPGGVTKKNFKLTSKNVIPCVLDNNQIGIAIPELYGSIRLLTTSDIDSIISTGVYKYGFQATTYSYINRTFSFIKPGEPKPEECDLSW